MATATRLDTDMSHWADGTLHYATSDGKYFAVEAYLPDCPNVVPAGCQPMVNELLAVLGTGRQATKHVVRPTVVFECDENGVATSLTPVTRFIPGTPHEKALRNLGYDVE